MCHIIQCITLGLDLIQRLITYFFACLIFVIVYIALTAALIAGITYGYKYYLAEYYTLNNTLQAIRRISLDPMRSEMAEFDSKHYKSLVEYYKFMATSTEATTTTENNPESLRIISPKQFPHLLVSKLLPEDEMNRATLDSEEDMERATVEADSLETRDVNEYVKKINWIVWNDNKTTVIKTSMEATVPVEERTRDWVPVTKKYWETKMTKSWISVPTSRWLFRSETTSRRLSEYADNRARLRYLVPVNKMAATSTTKKSKGMRFFVDKLKSALAHDIIRRTEEPLIMNAMNTTLIPDSKVISILRKHLMTDPNKVTTAAETPDEASTEGIFSDKPNTTPLKEYEKKLNLELAHRDKETEKEKIVLV